MWIPVCKANSPVYVSITSLDSHNVIYCCKFSCSDWFFCTFPIKHFLVSDLPWSMVSILEPELIFSGVFSSGFFAACPQCSTRLAVVLQCVFWKQAGLRRVGWQLGLWQSSDPASWSPSQPCCGAFLGHLECAPGVAPVRAVCQVHPVLSVCVCS